MSESVIFTFLSVIVVYGMNAKADALSFDEAKNRTNTKWSKVGKHVMFDCNISEDEISQAIWKRQTSDGDDLLFLGRVAIRNKDLTSIKLSSVNYSLILHSVTIKDEGLYTCSQSAKTLASYHLNVIAISEIQIQHKGTNVSEPILANKGDEVQLDCILFGTKREPIIVWQVRNEFLTENVNETVIKSANKFVDGTLDYRKRLNYFFKDDIELLCLSFEVYNRSASINILQQLTGKHTSYTTLVTLLCLAAVVSLFVGLFCIMRRRGTLLSVTIRLPHHESTTPPLKLPELDSSSKTIPTEHKESKMNSRRVLPDVPKERQSYARHINEEDLYSSVSYNLPSSKVFIRKSIRLITKLTDGIICERWIGNVTTADGEKKPALITHLKGVICFEHFSWDGFVKRFLELPENPHIFKVQGMCFDEPHLYLLQDYMPCESFVEHLCVKTNREETRKDMTTDFLVKKLTNLSLQVCYGMEFAMAYGLSHPGLSMKKILINEECVCKLYDFCLAEDASKIVKCLKSEADFMPSSHPPECVARNEYTCASDVWYGAFTVREIYSYGGRQFPCLSNLNREESLMYSLQPELCSSILYERVKTCMSPNHDERPKNLKGLLMDLKAEVNSVSAEDSPTQNEGKNARKYASYLPTIKAMDKKLYSTPVKLEKITIES